jgi:hypothetical protein
MCIKIPNLQYYMGVHDEAVATWGHCCSARLDRSNVILERAGFDL